MSKFFKTIQEMENAKWAVLEEKTTDKVYNALGTSKEKIYEVIDTKRNYTSPAFREAEDRGETFLPACWEFLTFNLIFTAVAFLLLRWGFKLLRRCRI